LDLKQLELSSDDQRLIGVPSKQLLNFELRNMILIASFFWRLTLSIPQIAAFLARYRILS
ncbi:hypothetical protein, partial [Vibrio parahaemolyticus]